ncbi:hypothetical protein [Methylorubrum aminovorans]
MTLIPTVASEFFISSSFEEMKEQIVPGEKVQMPPGRHEIRTHLSFLVGEFAGRSELELYHAIITVLIRRCIDLNENVERFRAIWRYHAPFLSENLDARWLVSACDTMMDHDPSHSNRGFALAGSAIGNVIKLYETERWALHLNELQPKLERLPTGPLPLHDGLTTFVVGYGDMVANLHRRARSVCADESPAARIFLELLSRASDSNTVFKRFRDLHKSRETLW